MTTPCPVEWAGRRPFVGCAAAQPYQSGLKVSTPFHARLRSRPAFCAQRKKKGSDRLLDAKTTSCGKWEAADNGTHPAVDLVPKDIILCDWHYGKRTEYPSIPFFLAKGFRVWPSGWNKVDATIALIASAQQHQNPKLLGHLCTTWGSVKIPQLADWPPIQTALRKWTK